MNFRTMLACGVVFAALTGCTHEVREPAPPANHPANPSAATAPPAKLSPTMNPHDTDVTPAQSTGAAAAGHADHTAAAATPAVPVVYTCPHHPKVMEAEPGECPFCGMKLVPTNSRNTSPLRATPETPSAPATPGADNPASTGQPK
jgi:hypothetical protein